MESIPGFERIRSLAPVMGMAVALAWAAPLYSQAPPAQPGPAAAQVLPAPGEKIPLGGEHYFVFGFTEPPRMGMAVMKVEIFTRAGKRDTSFSVKGDVDMPSMRGHHSSGDKAFALSAKGPYLLPVHLAMPGDWEFKFSFEKAGKAVKTGLYLFDL